MANHSSLAYKFQSNINKCDICYSEYNRREKQPVIICSMHHTVCRECMTGLEASRKCPYCRENINFSKIVVNNYIFELLPSDQASLIQPNTRQEIRQPQSVPFQPPPPNNYAEQDPISSPANRNPLSAHINNLPVQQFNPLNYYPQNNNNYQGYHPINNEDIILENRASTVEDCWRRIVSKLQLQNSDRKALYVTVLILQLPFLVLDFYFAKTGTDPACYDTPYENYVYILRPWLFAMAICEAIFMSSLLVADLLRICEKISMASLKCAEYTILAFMAVKILLWMYMQLKLFLSVIAPHCSGGIYAYGLLQAIVHAIILFILYFISYAR